MLPTSRLRYRGRPSRRLPLYERLQLKLSSLALGIVLAVGTFAAVRYVQGPSRSPRADIAVDAAEGGGARHLLQNEDAGDVRFVNEWPYPTEVFTENELSDGAILLHVLGVCYCFIALAIVCDEYFVSALEVITEKSGVSDDVAGATFMAAGGSAPELFTSFIGTFITKSNVGFGTIVGSAVFNVLFVIGVCAVFSKELLKLTWWPLFRDSTYYSISLLALVACFWDGVIDWWEALILFLMYGGYVLVMKFQVAIYEKMTGDKLGAVAPAEGTTEGGGPPPLSRHPSQGVSMSMFNAHTTFRAGVLHMMIRETDPLGKGVRKHQETRLHRAAQLVKDRIAVVRLKEAIGGVKEGEGQAASEIMQTVYDEAAAEPGAHANMTAVEQSKASLDGSGQLKEGDIAEDDGSEDEGPEWVTMEWPSDGHLRAKIWYVVVFPIMASMYFTIPDPRNPKYEKYFVLSFIMSIFWIGFYSLWMVGWATTFGRIAGIPDPVMGLTLLAAGTSVPDLLSSVIVARQGLGDMAVSSSIGSNIFDVLVGLPVPWLFSTLIEGQSIAVGTAGLKFSVLVLLLMLVFVVLIIKMSGWEMTKGLGYSMFVLYLMFVTLNLLVEYGHINVDF